MFKILKRKTKKLNQKGVALLMAMFCVMIMAFLAVEISFDTSVEYILTNKEFHRVKAYEAAKAGLELSLLRVQLFKNVTKQFGDQLKGQESIIQMIWSLPFSWPPMIPESTSIVSKDQLNTSLSESFMEARYVTQISAEGSKIDINDLDSPSETLRNATRDQLERIFIQRLENDDDWAQRNRNLNYEEIINNLQDWIDEDTTSLNGGNENNLYPDVEDDAQIPPNRPFQTMDEIKMVSGVTEDIFRFLLPHITVYGTKGISVNQASPEILQSIDPIINEEMADRIIERINNLDEGGPFRDEQDFMSFIGANQQTFNPSKIPLLFGSEYNFRIRSIGEFQNVTREIIAIVYDIEAVRDQLITILDSEQTDPNNQNQSDNQDQNQNQNNNQDTNQNQNQNQNQQQQQKPSTTKPRIIYWWEN